MSLDEELDRLAELESGEGIIAPERGRTSEAFQATLRATQSH